MGRMFAGLEARVITRETVKEAYRHLLGRVPSDSETALMVAHFSAGGIDQTAELHDSIFRSEEFRCRRVNTYRWEQFHPLELDSPRLVFVHIEKCAGTTLRMMLETQFSPSRICPERFDGLGNWTINELASYDLFAGHFNLSVTRSIPGRVRVITMLREPKARLISLFHFWKSHLPDAGRDGHNLMVMAREMDAVSFFSDPFVRSHPSIREAMAAQLIATNGKQIVESDNILITDAPAALRMAWARIRGMSAFGIAERFDDSRRLLNRTLGLHMNATEPAQVLADLAAHNPELRKVPKIPRTRELEAILDGLVVVDAALYRRAVTLFARRMSWSYRLPAWLGARGSA